MTKKLPTALILAGGKGTRLAGLYPDTPKPMIPVAGQPFVSWVTAWLVQQGLRDFVYSTGYLAAVVQDWCRAPVFAPSVTRRWRHEETPLGTGGGILNCLEACGEDVLALNGDSLLLCDLAPMFAAFQNADAVMLGSWVADSSRYGTLDSGEDGFLRAFHEKRPGEGYINGGLYLMRQSWLRRFPRNVPLSMEYDVIPEMLKQGARIAVHKVKDAPFLDIGLPETVAQADDFIRANQSWFTARDVA